MGNAEVVDDIVIKSKQGIITAYDLEKCIDEYTQKIHDPNDLYKPGNKSFNGLLLYLYKHCIKRVLPNTYNHDYNLLDEIFNNIYIPLTYYYNRIATINNFCVLIQIDYSIFYDIKTGTYRAYWDNVSITTKQIIKKWLSICDGELIDNVVHTGNIGAMFLAKVHGFREDNTMTIEIKSDLPQITAEQLGEIATNAALKLPE